MLQGSLDNFALDEVLGLLSGTSKSGQLDIKGDRGQGSLVFDGGNLVDGSASFTANGTEIEDVMFELLRYTDGTFSFTSRSVEATEISENVNVVLTSAENRLADWRQIEAVVPSLDHMVTPAPELPEEEVTINRSEWAVLTVIAAGCPASTVCDLLHMGEVEGSRQIKNLAERQLVNIGPPRGGGSPSSRPGTSSVSRPMRAPSSTMAGSTLGDSGYTPAPPSSLPRSSIDEPKVGSEAVASLAGTNVPPSLSEINEFSDGLSRGGVDDELASSGSFKTDGDEADGSAGGLLMKYLKTDN